MENTKRIYLLSSTEIEELYARPAFNAHEQHVNADHKDLYQWCNSLKCYTRSIYVELPYNY